MPFITLLFLLSLIIIIPVFFVLKERSARQQLNDKTQHRDYLKAKAQARMSTTTDKLSDTSPHSEHAITVIQFSSHHPYMQLLHSPHVPQEFQLILDDIGQHYESTHHDQINESQLFALNKLIEVRIPELIQNYLKLDKHYAHSVIIDKQNQATSFELVILQLESILDFCKRLNAQSQSGVVDKLLANRFYLEQVYQDSGMDVDELSIDNFNDKNQI